MSRVGGNLRSTPGRFAIEDHGDTMAALVRGFLCKRSGARLIVQWTDLRIRLPFKKTPHD
jgi:hypothetical protein